MSWWCGSLALCLRLLSAVFLLCTLPLTARAAATYVLVVVPQFPAPEIQRDWQPLLDRLRATSGIELKIRHVRSIPEFENEFSRGLPDFVFMNPYHAVMARQSQGYIPLVRASAPLTGILVARKDGAVGKVADLDGKELAFPALNAFGASLYMRTLLQEKLGLRIVPRYVKTHSNVFRAVLAGDVPAGGAVSSTLAQESAAVRDRLRVLFETPAVASHPLAAHPRVPESVRRELTNAILGIARSADGAALLEPVQLVSPVTADYARDYLPLERLNLGAYFVRSE